MKKFNTLFSALLLITAGMQVNAQLCSNPADSVYGMSTNGQFHSININTGVPSANMLGNDTVLNAKNSNGLGYSSLTGRFYFFNHCANNDFIEFVSYDPITKIKQVLASPPAPMVATGTTDKIRTGAVNNSGTGYYTILTNKPASSATFYYYDIPLGTWKIIAQNFKDTATAASLNTSFNNLNSGDMTFDGAGNLWIICSKSPDYALYKVAAPVTTNTVPKLAVTIIIPTRKMPHVTSVASFTGVAFNSAGKLYLTTGSNSALPVGTPSVAGQDYNILYRMTSFSPLVIDSITRLPNSYGDDLTSCAFPAGVLASSFNSFTAALQNNSAMLSWKINEPEEVNGYDVEYSNDAEHWQTIGHKDANNSGTGLKTYSYQHNGLSLGRNYYRLIQLFTSGKKSISEIRLIDTRNLEKIYIGPNPANDVIYFYNKSNNSKLLAKVFNSTGQLVYSTIIAPDQQSIDISHLQRGSFILTLSSNTKEDPQSYHFIKW